MRKLNLLFKSLFLLCALIVGSSAWAGEPVVIWSEDFSGLAANATPTTPTNTSYTGVTYTCTDGTGTSPGTTKIMNEKLAGGAAAPEMMIGKKGSGTGAAGGKFTAVIPLDKFEGTLTLTYYQNKQTLNVSSPTTGVSGGQSLKPSEVGQQTTTFTGITAAMTSITIVFESTTTNNVRLDDIVLKGTKASGKTATTVTINGTPSTEVYMGDAVTSPTSATVKAGETSISSTVTWSSSNTDVATINSSNGAISLVGPGVTTIKASFAETATHNASEASYELKVYGKATTLAELQTICQAYGNTAMKAKVTLNNVYVTGVKNSNAYISDGTNGAVIYKNSHGFNAGDKLSCSALEMTVQNYNGAAEITSLTSGSTGLTVTPGQTITPTAMSVNAITAANYGTLVKIIGVTYDATAGAFKDNSDNSIVFYDNFSANPTLNDGEEYDVTGVILLKNDVVEICPRTAADVVAKSIKTTPTSAWKLGGNAVSSIAVTRGGSVTVSFETNSTGTKSFVSSNPDVATVSNTGAITLTGAAGITTITATTAANNTYYVSESSLIVVVGEPVVDGVFDFTGYQDYGSGVIPTSANDYTEVDKTWTAGNIAMTTSGKIRWFIGTNGLDLKLYTKKVSEIETTKFTIAAPAGKKLTKIVISGSGHGSLVAEGYNAGTWTGLADNVTFTYGGSGTIGITKITVYYAGPTISVTMNNEGYMTYCNVGAALSFAGVKAYKVSSVADDHVNLIEVTEAPANTPVILEANPGNYNLTVIASATSVGTNKLRVSDGTAMNTDQYDVYALANKEKGVGFYKLGDDVTVPAGKCYISVSKATPSTREFLSIGDDATGIKAVEGVTERGVVYDLQGRRVAQPTRGLYIEKGKKVIIK